VLESFRHTIDERHATVTLLPVPWLAYDKVKFQAVIGNLLSNAIKFHRPGVPPEVTIAGEEMPDGTVVITVRDNGVGIPEEQIARIFEPGRRLYHRNVYPGSGLGLASVKMIVDRCGGEIEVHSSVGDGSTFVLSLPGDQDRGHD
jgi:signal transduction histidine kinase